MLICILADNYFLSLDALKRFKVYGEQYFMFNFMVNWFMKRGNNMHMYNAILYTGNSQRKTKNCSL